MGKKKNKSQSTPQSAKVCLDHPEHARAACTRLDKAVILPPPTGLLQVLSRQQGVVQAAPRLAGIPRFLDSSNRKKIIFLELKKEKKHDPSACMSSRRRKTSVSGCYPPCTSPPPVALSDSSSRLFLSNCDCSQRRRRRRTLAQRLSLTPSRRLQKKRNLEMISCTRLRQTKKRKITQQSCPLWLHVNLKQRELKKKKKKSHEQFIEDEVKNITAGVTKYMHVIFKKNED